MPLIEEAVFPLLHIFASFFKDKVPKVLEFISGLSILLHWVFQFKNWYVSPSVYVIFDFFHQCLIVFFIQLFVHLFLDILLLMLPWWMELILYFLFQIFAASVLEFNGFLCIGFVSWNLTKLTDYSSQFLMVFVWFSLYSIMLSPMKVLLLLFQSGSLFFLVSLYCQLKLTRILPFHHGCEIRTVIWNISRGKDKVKISSIENQ